MSSEIYVKTKCADSFIQTDVRGNGAVSAKNSGHHYDYEQQEHGQQTHNIVRIFWSADWEYHEIWPQAMGLDRARQI